MTVDAWELVARSQAGDAEAFGELYDRYIEQIYAFIHRKVRNHAVAEDLTADTFFKALRSIGRLERQRDSPLNWLHTIARNTVNDHLRSARVRLVHSPEALPDLVDPDPQPDQQAARNRDAIMIRGLIRRLTGDQRRCLELRYLYGLTVAETAERMQRTPSAVRVLHMRAIRRLRTIIDDAVPED